MYARLIRLELSELQGLGAIESVSRITRDTTLLQLGFKVLVGKSVTQAARGFGAFAAALVLEWRLTLFAVVVAPPLALRCEGWGSGYAEAVVDHSRRPRSWAAWPRNPCRDCVPSKWLRLKPGLATDSKLKMTICVDTTRKVALVTALASPITETLAIFALLGICLLSVRQVLDGGLSLDRFLLVLAALGAAGGSFRPLAGLHAQVQAAKPPADRLSTLLELPIETGGAEELSATVNQSNSATSR